MRYFLLLVTVLLSGCYSMEAVNFRLDSDPQGAKVELNGTIIGTTPCTIPLRFQVERGSILGGMRKRQYVWPMYVLKCYPPPNSKGTLYTQTKTIQPYLVTIGGSPEVFFDLHLNTVTPVQRINVTSE